MITVDKLDQLRYDADERWFAIERPARDALREALATRPDGREPGQWSVVSTPGGGIGFEFTDVYPLGREARQL